MKVAIRPVQQHREQCSVVTSLYNERQHAIGRPIHVYVPVPVTRS